MTDLNQPKTVEENDMTNDPLIALNAFRRMRAYPAVYGLGPWTESLLEHGFLCGPGWHPLIERLSADLSVIIRQDGLIRFRVVQVKEKMGELRFYIRGGNERALDRISDAARESDVTCEGCGCASQIRAIDGWLTTLCESCR